LDNRVNAMRILITGASGFIGRQASEIAVGRGAAVHAVVSSMPAERVAGVEYHVIDLLGDVAAMQERIAAIAATHTLHLAWYAVPGKFWTAAENAQWVDATLALARVFGESGGTRFVGAGSCAEYEWASGVCAEATTPCVPATPYGVAKDTTRRLLEQWAEQAGVSFAWGRIFFLYGPGEAGERLIPSVIRALLSGEHAPVTEGRQVRDFLHVRDVADALVTLLLSDVRGAVNIAAGEPVAVRDVVAMIGEALQACGRIRYGAIPMRADEPAVLIGDAARLRDELAWKPQFNLRDGLRDTIDWWRSVLSAT
jgi:nucleoside-diphosphate-sugar epimerase